MNRRNALLAASISTIPVHGIAGLMDLFNGVKLGAVLPEFDAEYLNKAPSTTRKLLLIDFWATWCAPCREEFPHLNALHSRFATHGLVVVGLTQESKDVAQAFLQKSDLRYIIGAAGVNPLQKRLGIKALPYAILVDQSNTIIWRGQASSLTAEQVEQRLSNAA